MKIFGFRIQGYLPAHQQQFAEKLGRWSGEMVSLTEISSKINNPETIAKAMPFIENHIDHFIKVKLKEEIPLLSMFINEKTMGGIKKGIVEEIEELIPALLTQMTGNLQEDLNIEKIIADKVNGYSLDTLEEMMRTSMRNEFRVIKITGALTGFIIGLIQVLLTLKW